jgi:hypothetical protein
LKPESAKKRRRFAALWRRNPRLTEVIYSDECSIQRKPNNTVEFVFRYQKEALRQDLVTLTSHGNDISQMIWAAVWRGGRSELVIMAHGGWELTKVSGSARVARGALARRGFQQITNSNAAVGEVNQNHTVDKRPANSRSCYHLRRIERTSCPTAADRKPIDCETLQ